LGFSVSALADSLVVVVVLRLSALAVSSKAISNKSMTVRALHV
jgi:hypothetical protein